MLEGRIADVLARLSTLSEAPSGNLEAHISRSAPEATIPTGATTRHDSFRPPPKERSLYDWYRWQFDRHADQPSRLLSLYLLAEREYLLRTCREIAEEAAQRGSIAAYSEDGALVESVRAKLVIEWYEDVHPRDVATAEGATEAWVRKVRRQAKLNPDDGRPRPAFLDWPEEERRRKVAACKIEGLGQELTAQRLGVSKRTVQTYWPRDAEPAPIAA